MKFLGQKEITYRFNRHLGPRCQGAGLTLQLSAADTYSYLSKAQWPTLSEDFGAAVERGVRDGLLEAGYDLELGILIILKSVEFHEVDSSEKAFYIAAKCAAASMAGMK